MSDIPLEPGLQDTGSIADLCPMQEDEAAPYIVQRLHWVGAKFTPFEVGEDASGRKRTANENLEFVRYPFGSPSREYGHCIGLPPLTFDPQTPATLQDVLTAILVSADCLFFELRKIREAASITFAGRDQ